jgi:glutathione S-transferase
MRVVRGVFDGEVDENDPDIRAAATDLHAEFARIEGALASQPWLTGDQLSAADILGHSAIEFFLHLIARDVFKPLDLGFDDMASRYPALSAWRERTTKIPGYDNAYPPHWRSP